MEISKYVKQFKIHNKIYLYNTINSCILEFSDDYLDGDQINLMKLNQQEYDYMNDNQFFFTGDDAINFIKDDDMQVDTYNLIISFNQCCNLACKYCYQNYYDSTNEISYEVIDNTIKYLKNYVFINEKYKFLDIDIIGGEPLLSKDKIEYFIRQLDFINKDNIFITVETNGTLINKEIFNILREFNVNFHITLSYKQDHDTYRPYKSKEGSYNTIINNLIKYGKYFQKENFNLIIRYNVNDTNISKFTDFINELKEILNYKFQIDIAYTSNYEYNDSKNTLSIIDYKNWKVETSFEYPELELISLEDLCRTQYKSCFAYAQNGVKVFEDGSLGLCNAWKFNDRRSNIKNLAEGKDYYEDFKDIFSQRKNIEKECINCENVFICGGKKFCRENDQCDFLDFNIDKYLKRIIMKGDLL